jgi:hypothetical protein
MADQIGEIPFTYEERLSRGNSNFQAMALSLQRSWASGWMMRANYTWTHAIDDLPVPGELPYPQNFLCMACERGNSDFDTRHMFNIDAAYQLPFGPHSRFLKQRGPAQRFLEGWELIGTATLRSGYPVNVTAANAGYFGGRPNVVPGVSATPPGGRTPNLWINPAAFTLPEDGDYGNAAKNIVTGPGGFQVDVALAKRAKISERMGLEFRVAGFNLLNHPQYGNPDGELTDSTFGMITAPLNPGATGTGTARQLQAAVRIDF